MGNESVDLHEILKEASSTFRIFPLKRSIMENPGMALVWKHDNNPVEFLEFAREASAKVLYHYLRENGDSSQGEYHELAYIDNGFIHVFCHKYTDDVWAGKENKDRSSVVPSIADRKPDDVAAEMADYVMLNLDYMSPDSFNLQYFFKKYWQSRGLDPAAPPGSALRKYMDAVEDAATRKIKSRR